MDEPTSTEQPGMSLLDHFAGLAMQALVQIGGAGEAEKADFPAYYGGVIEGGQTRAADGTSERAHGTVSIASDAYTLAEAMLRERDDRMKAARRDALAARLAAEAAREDKPV
jgi:hypothetical protein